MEQLPDEEWAAIEMAMAQVETKPQRAPQPTPQKPTNSVHANRPFTPKPAVPTTQPTQRSNYPNSPNKSNATQQINRASPNPSTTANTPKSRSLLPPAYNRQQTAFSYSSSIQDESQMEGGGHFRKLTNRFNKDASAATTPTTTSASSSAAVTTPSSTSTPSTPYTPTVNLPRSSNAKPPPPKPSQPTKPQYPPVFSYGYPAPAPRPTTPTAKWNSRFASLCQNPDDRIPVEFQLISKTHFCAMGDAEQPGFQPAKKTTPKRGRGRGGFMRGGKGKAADSGSKTRGVNPLREQKNDLFAEIFATLPGVSRDENKKWWTFPLTSYEKLKALLEEIPKLNVNPLPNRVVDIFLRKMSKPLNKDVDLRRIPANLLNTLYPFQQEGVLFALQRNGRALIGDEMGLGKTLQAVAVAAYYRSEWPCLVVCPSSVRMAWAEAFEVRLGVKQENIRVIMTGKTPADGEVNITSYDLVVSKDKELLTQNFRVVIVDESHNLKSHKAKRTTALVPILHNARRCILLTGTPALSRPSELWTQLNAVDQETYSNFFTFGVRYCAGFKDDFGWNFAGSSNLTELHLLLESTVMIRRLKDDVLKSLPEKRRQQVFINIVDKHQKVIDKIFTEMKENSRLLYSKRGGDEKYKEARSNSYRLLMELYKSSGTSKLPAVTAWIKELLGTANKFLVFGHHQDVLNGIALMLNNEGINYIRIDGKTAPQDRQQLVDHFQTTEDCRVGLLSMTAAGVGLTLTAANIVVFAELYWNPGVLRQAEDRAHRIGQTSTVNVYYLVAKGTLDEMIWDLIKLKLEVLGSTLNGQEEILDVAAIEDGKIPDKVDGFLQEIMQKVENYDVRKREYEERKLAIQNAASDIQHGLSIAEEGAAAHGEAANGWDDAAVVAATDESYYYDQQYDGGVNNQQQVYNEEAGYAAYGEGAAQEGNYDYNQEGYSEVAAEAGDNQDYSNYDPNNQQQQEYNQDGVYAEGGYYEGTEGYAATGQEQQTDLGVDTSAYDATAYHSAGYDQGGEGGAYSEVYNGVNGGVGEDGYQQAQQPYDGTEGNGNYDGYGNYENGGYTYEEGAYQQQGEYDQQAATGDEVHMADYGNEGYAEQRNVESIPVDTAEAALQPPPKPMSITSRLSAAAAKKRKRFFIEEKEDSDDDFEEPTKKPSAPKKAKPTEPTTPSLNTQPTTTKPATPRASRPTTAATIGGSPQRPAPLPPSSISATPQTPQSQGGVKPTIRSGMLHQLAYQRKKVG